MRAASILLLASLLAAVSPGARGGAGEARVLRIGTSGDYAPFSRAGEGFDVEVARRLARDLGARIEWVAFRWPELRAKAAAGEFDVAMSGVTWRPRRAVLGWMSRAVAVSGPCVLGDAEPLRIAVNRGGILEQWTRRRFRGSAIVAVEKNLSLPELLERRDVDAIVTDRFELPHFRRAGWPEHCQPARDRKVYWVTPAGGAELASEIDLWLASHEPELDALRSRWLGGSAPRDELDHLIDLLGRRLELMPAVAAWKRTHERPIEDLAREAVVLEGAKRRAALAGLAPASAARFFAVQIELAKAVQRRSPLSGAALELRAQLRPAIARLGERILESLSRLAPLDADALSPGRLELLSELLSSDELERLRRALGAVRRAN